MDHSAALSAPSRRTRRIVRAAPAPPSATGFGEPVAAIMCEDWDLPVRNVAELNGYRRALEAVAPAVNLLTYDG
jgi:hypothetical protein